MEYCYSVVKNEIMNLAEKQMELEKITLGEETQTQRNKCLTFSLFGEPRAPRPKSSAVSKYPGVNHRNQGRKQQDNHRQDRSVGER